MRSYNVLKARAGIPVDDPMAVLFARIMRKEHYGMRWAKSTADPRGRCEYLYDCADWTPMQCQSDGTVSRGSWTDDSAFFLRHLYPVMCRSDGTEDYKLSKSDHAYKEDGVTASDAANTSYNGNAMVCFDCHIWIRFFEDDAYQGFEVANARLGEGFVDFPYIRADGSHADKLYYPMFEGTLVDGKLRSIGTDKAHGGTTAAEELTAAQANDGLGSGSVWSIGDWSHHLWLTLLSMLVGKTTAPELAFGAGNCSGWYGEGAFVTNGALKDKGAFWGKPYSSSPSQNTNPVKLFYIENPYANRWKRTLGMYNANGTYYVKTAPPYTIDETYAGYENCGAMPSGNGYIKDLKVTSCGLLPSTIGGSAATYEGAYHFRVDSASNCKMLTTGGRLGDDAGSGSWCLGFYVLPSTHEWSVGASLYLIQPEQEV